MMLMYWNNVVRERRIIRGVLWAVGLIGLLGLEIVATEKVSAADPLHVRIDTAIAAGHSGALGKVATDAEFLRRVYLDLHGTVPTTEQVRAFLADEAEDKRLKVVDQLLADPRFSRFMATTFDVMIMERQPDKHVKTPAWRTYLYESFLSGKGLDQLSREILSADGADPKLRSAVRFYLDREGEPNRLTRDVGRIFFGMDLQCAQCHDHPLIDDYYQEDYYGIFAFLNRSFVFTAKDKKVFFAEKAEGNVSFKSVFTQEAGQSGPCLPEAMPIEEPQFKKGEEYQVKPAKNVRPIPKYSRRKQLAARATSGENLAFNRNLANRLWAHMMGKGLVEPVDLYHSDNPAVNPELMELLATELVQLKFDLRAFLRELALSQTYQRSLDVPTGPSLTKDQVQQQLVALEADHKQRVVASQQLSNEIEELRKQRLQEKEKLAPLTKQLAGLSKPLEELRKKATAAQKVASESQKQLTMKRSQLVSLEAAAASTEQAAKALPKEAELQKAAGTLRKRAQQLKPQVVAAEKDYQPKNVAAVSASKMLAEKEQLATELNTQANQLQDKIGQLTVQVRGTRSKYQQQNQLVTLIAEQITDINRLVEYGGLVAAANQSRQGFEKIEDEFQSMTAKVTSLSSSLADLEKALQKAQQTNATATKEVARLQRRQSALEQLDQLLPQLANDLEKVSTQLPKDQEVVDVQQQIKQRLATLPTVTNQTAKSLLETEAVVKSSGKQMGDMQPRVAKGKQELADLTPQATALKKQFESARSLAKENEEKRMAVYHKLVERSERQFAVASLKPMTPEQIAWSTMQVLGVVQKQRVASQAELDKKSPLSEADQKDPAKLAERAKQLEDAVYAKLKGNEASFVKLFGAGAGQPQGDFFATVDQALFMANGGLIRGWLSPSSGNLSDRLNKQTDSPALVEDLYISILSRRPTQGETESVIQYLSDRGKERSQAIQEIVWALVTSVEFRFNH